MTLSQEVLSKIKSYLGFSQKAGTAVLGTDRILENKKVKLVFIENSLSENAVKKINKHCAEINCLVIKVDNLALLSSIEGCKAIGTHDKNLADAIYNSISLPKVK